MIAPDEMIEKLGEKNILGTISCFDSRLSISATRCLPFVSFCFVLFTFVFVSARATSN